MVVSEHATPKDGIETTEHVAREVGSRPPGFQLHQPAEPQATAERETEGLAPSLLDLRTQLGATGHGQIQSFGWMFTYWPDCHEASLCVVTSGSRRRSGSRHGLAKSDEAAAFLWEMANGRAATRSLRYFVVNQLRYMWVLTFAASHTNRREVMAQVADFARRLKVVRGGEPFPYWYSPELHPGGHGWHVNFFVPFRFAHAQIEALWGHGFVWVTDFASSMKGPKGEPLGLSRTPREGLRRAAHYGCKYSQKDWSPEHVGAKNHRYEVAQGFAPEKVCGLVPGPNHAEQLVAELVPEGEWINVMRWDSNDEDEWTRPPIRTWRW